MSLDLINQYVTRIILAIEPGDSINNLSKKTGFSYGWTHKWVERLEQANIIERDNGLEIVDREVSERYTTLAQTVFTRQLDLEEAYLLPNFSGMNYRYSKIDAVYIWTKGGYQIARNRDNYPIFIDILTQDLPEWKEFMDSFSIRYSVEERKQGDIGVYFVLNPMERFDSEWFENTSVTPLPETVEWATKYRYNFEPALEMLDEMYELDLGVEYSERDAI